MAELKKRGRPKKQPNESNIKNEETKQINMTQKEYKEEEVNLNSVQNRWAQIFGKYANMGFEAISTAWNQAWSSLNNPFLQNQRIKQSIGRASKASQEELQNALANPENSELTLSRFSIWLYYTNYVYNVLIKLNRETPNYNFYALPQYVDEKDYQTDVFKKEAQKVDKILKTFNPQLTFKTVATQVNLEGKSSYLARISYDKNNINFFLLQKLNPDMVKLTGFGSEQKFICSFNMMIFLQPSYDVSQYPEFIQQVWEDMNNNNIIISNKKGEKVLNPKANIPINHILEWNGKYYMYWVQLPQDLAYTFYTDGAHAMSFPDTIGMFNDFGDLDDYKWLQASLLSKGVNSVLTAEVPLTKDAKPGSDSTIITPDTILGYQDLFTNSISGNIFPFFAPFQKFELHTLENQPESMDIIFDRTRDLIATSGNSSLLSITDKPSIASVKAAQYIQASKCDYLTRQFEEFLNNIINKDFELKYTWKVYLWGDIFNNREDVKILKELVFSGMDGFFPKLLSSQNMTVEDYKSASLLVKSMNLKIKDDKESDNISLNNQVGRPKLNDDEVLNDNTGISQDMGNNVSDIKEFNKKNTCYICKKQLKDDENFICDNCLELIYKDREFSSNLDEKGVGYE